MTFVYLGSPIDHRTSDESWKVAVASWLRKSDIHIFDPEVVGARLLEQGANLRSVWLRSREMLNSCDYALFHWGDLSVGTHYEIVHCRDNPPRLGFSVWGLGKVKVEGRAALHSLREGKEYGLTLSGVIANSVIPSLALGDVNLEERLRETWDTTSLSLNGLSFLPEATQRSPIT